MKKIRAIIMAPTILKNIIKFVWYHPGEFYSSAEQWHDQYLKTDRAKKRIKYLEAALKFDDSDIPKWKEECARLQEQVKKLKAEITHQNNVLKYKNRQLDALNFVWCTGGCDGGFHRHDGKGPESLTEEIIHDAINNVNRLIAYFNNREFKQLDLMDDDKIKNRFLYINTVKAIKEALKIEESCGSDAAWKIVKNAVK